MSREGRHCRSFKIEQDVKTETDPRVLLRSLKKKLEEKQLKTKVLGVTIRGSCYRKDSLHYRTLGDRL